MILGAVRDEIPLLESFRKMGYRVVVVGKGGDYPCCKLADRFYDVDLRDFPAMLEVAKAEGISAVASNVVSIAVQGTAWIAEEMGLPGIGYETARSFTNKHKMRCLTRDAGVANPAFALATTLDEAVAFADEMGYPLVVKPVDGNSSRGVHKAVDEESLKRVFYDSLGHALSDKAVLVEEFIEGDEYIVDSFCCGGKCINTDVAVKEHFDLADGFVSKAVVIQDAPHCESEWERKLLEANKRTVEALGLPYGPTHGEYIISSKDGKAYLVEVAARGGGIRLSSDLIPLATGVPVSELVARYSAGDETVSASGLEMKHGSAAWFAFSLPKGRVTGVSGVEECLALDGVHCLDLDKVVVGERSLDLVNDDGKYGPLVVYGLSRSDCFKLRDAAKGVLNVEVDGRPWSATW